MEAQTLQVRRTIRFPWKVLLVAALLAVMLAVGIGVATRGGDTTTVPPRTVQTIGPKDLSGPTAYPGFLPGGHVPNWVSKQAVAAGSNDHQAAVGITAPSGKPLS